ncbi:MAG TPA: ATP-binding protein [Candidatus Nanopelagicaceae bacterium]|nr:ATP-binding protein [Candidatus Nanopelagicaceae bacterium]
MQAGVLTLIALHDVVLVKLHLESLAGVPSPLTSKLLLIPVLYAAFNFGMRGAVSTSLWATALLPPHWLLIDHVSAAHVWIEFTFLIILNSVAFVVGQRVEREQKARARAEEALLAANLAKSRYYSLFEDQFSPILITDLDGVVNEANGAANRLAGGPVSGRPLDDVISVNIEQLLSREISCLTLGNAEGETRFFTPSAQILASEQGSVLVQVVLTDITEQRRRQEEQRSFADQLVSVQEEERRRLARELHDEPLQHLTYLTRVLDDLANDKDTPEALALRLEQNIGVANDAATALSKLIHGLRPPVLDDLGLVSALRQLTDGARKRIGLNIDLDVTGAQTRLPEDLELATYRIAQESLTNAVKHADPKSIQVHLDFGTALILTVTDDGCGIPQEPGETTPGLGLIGMRERVMMAGGQLELLMNWPSGTIVRATFPLQYGLSAGSEESCGATRDTTKSAPTQVLASLE